MSINKNFYEVYWEQRNRAQRKGDRNGYEPFMRRWMARELGSQNKVSRLLEVGCGDCQFTENCAEHADSVTAIDISDFQIQKNKLKLPEIDFVVHDLGEVMPFADNAFDVIWCSEVLEHLFDPQFALSEMFRVLRPGGKLLTTVPFHGGLKNLLIALFKWDEHFNPQGPHIRFFTRRSMNKLVQRVGFTKIEQSVCGNGSVLRDLVIKTNLLTSASKMVGNL